MSDEIESVSSVSSGESSVSNTNNGPTVISVTVVFTGAFQAVDWDLG